MFDVSEIQSVKESASGYVVATIDGRTVSVPAGAGDLNAAIAEWAAIQGNAIEAQTTISDAINDAHQRVRDGFDGAIALLTAGYPAKEVDTWPEQEAEARTYTADNTAVVPLLEGLEAMQPVPDVAARAASIIAKADAMRLAVEGIVGQPIIVPGSTYDACMAALVGRRHRLKDQINAPGATVADIDLVVW